MEYFILTFLDLLLTVLTFAIIGRALLSWFDPGFRNLISRFLFDATEPILRPIRSVMPFGGPIDFSPLIALLILTVLRRAIGV